MDQNYFLSTTPSVHFLSVILDSYIFIKLIVILQQVSISFSLFLIFYAPKKFTSLNSRTKS
jgi:hypothetical protein